MTMGTRIEKVMARVLELEAELALHKLTIKLQEAIDEYLVLKKEADDNMQNLALWLFNCEKAEKKVIRMIRNAAKTYDIKTPSFTDSAYSWVSSWNHFCAMHDHWDNNLYID